MPVGLRHAMRYPAPSPGGTANHGWVFIIARLPLCYSLCGTSCTGQAGNQHTSGKPGRASGQRIGEIQVRENPQFYMGKSTYPGGLSHASQAVAGPSLSSIPYTLRAVIVALSSVLVPFSAVLTNSSESFELTG
mgnify:CR=1 FL=1